MPLPAAQQYAQQIFQGPPPQQSSHPGQQSGGWHGPQWNATNPQQGFAPGYTFNNGMWQAPDNGPRPSFSNAPPPGTRPGPGRPGGNIPQSNIPGNPGSYLNQGSGTGNQYPNYGGGQMGRGGFAQGNLPGQAGGNFAGGNQMGRGGFGGQGFMGGNLPYGGQGQQQQLMMQAMGQLGQMNGKPGDPFGQFGGQMGQMGGFSPFFNQNSGRMWELFNTGGLAGDPNNMFGPADPGMGGGMPPPDGSIDPQIPPSTSGGDYLAALQDMVAGFQGQRPNEYAGKPQVVPGQNSILQNQDNIYNYGADDRRYMFGPDRITSGNPQMNGPGGYSSTVGADGRTGTLANHDFSGALDWFGRPQEFFDGLGGGAASFWNSLTSRMPFINPD